LDAVRLLLVLAALATLSGCGPIQSTSALVDADVQLEAARTAGAATSAPYEFTAAEAYLHKAREEAGYAQYEASADFATRARDLAKTARQKAVDASNRGEAP
jgi:hypothetical protein